MRARAACAPAAASAPAYKKDVPAVVLFSEQVVTIAPDGRIKGNTQTAYLLALDPLELRRRNHAAVHPHSGHPWSSNALLECYTVGAERFGWHARTPAPRSMRDGRLLVGYGMARAALSAYQAPCTALATLRRDGSASIRSGATDIGAGTYTVITQLAAERLGLGVDVAAPGDCILSLGRTGKRRNQSGTSSASPHVAGAAAICCGCGPSRRRSRSGLTPIGCRRARRGFTASASASTTA